MSTLTNQRERITAKDVGAIMGFGRTKSFAYYRQLKLAKKSRAQLAQATQQFYVYVDDLVEASGLSKETIKAALK